MSEKKRPKTTVEAMNDFTAAVNECGRLIRVEVERTAKQINAIWKRVSSK